jgi:hypothetical protein
VIRSVARRVARLYFDSSYRLLAGSEAGRRLLALPAERDAAHIRALEEAA